MNTKILLLAFSVAAISSCSTAYKSGQTPDDVYYSPARYEENKDENKRDDDQNQASESAEDRRIRQTIRDRRWRETNDYDYTYTNSPYNHCYCNCTSYGYYYNPYYYSTPIYTTTPVKNTTPRKVNLNSYQGYNASNAQTTNPKYNAVIAPAPPKYNNKNSLGSKIVKVFTSKEYSPSNTESNTSSSSSNSNTRSYTPSSSTSSSSSSSSSSAGSGSSVSRPTRGGN
ncbi:MAG: hypothetical protein IPP48_00700 [Chitinophagaceae bacterium]|nr:hypothetical protein [Chitinophagaceae bacterium]